MMLWRQQDDLGIPLIRTAEVRYPGTAIDGPFEQHDLSAFCASENHAVKVGTYIISRRNHITHRLRIGVKPDAFNPTLAAGDLVRVRLERTPSTGAASVHDYLYEVDRIGKSISGEVRLELTHFPVDSNFASVVAQEVNAAVGAGFVLPTGLSGITCDVNSPTDTTVPADTSLDPGDWDLPDDGSFDNDVTEVPPVDFPGVSGGFSGGPDGPGSGGGDPTGDNPQDPLDPQGPLPTPAPAPIGPDGPGSTPAPGDPLTVPAYCEGGRITWYRSNPAAPGGREVIGQGDTYTPTPGDAPYPIFYEVECPEPSSPTGYSEPTPSAPVDPWNRFPSAGTLAVTITIGIEKGEWRWCDDNSFASGADSDSDNIGTTLHANAIGWRPADNVASYNYICVGPENPRDVSLGYFVLYSNGTTERVGGDVENTGDVFLNSSGRAVRGTYVITWTVTATFNGAPI